MDYETSEEPIDEQWVDRSLEELHVEKVEKRGRPSGYPSWTKEETFSLISLFKEQPLLYDTTHPKYAIPIHRKKALWEIHDDMQIYKPNVTIPEIRAKLKTLRSQYIKEKRKTSNKKYIPKFWCYDRMRFLDNRGKFLEDEREPKQEQSLPGHSQQFQVGEQPDDCYVVENENEIFVKSYDESDSDEKPESFQSEVTEQRPRSVLYKKCLGLVETLSTLMKDGTILDPMKSKAPASLLGRMVETELSNFPEHIYDDAKWKIIKVLEEASKKNKQLNSS